MGHASDQRLAFSTALLSVGADAPTLCDGWTAFDLAAHCWVRERRPKALLGIASERFAHFATDEMDRAKEQLSFVEMATRLRETPKTPLTLIPGADNLVNALEYFIHTEDVLRANGKAPHEVDPTFEIVLWRRLPLVGRALFAKAPVGVRCEWEGTDTAPQRVKAGASTVTLLGRPSEMMMFAFGRQDAAKLQLIGLDADVLALKNAPLGA